MATLDCFYNELTSLPELPKGLNYLNCFNNQLTSLPVLPKGLRLLYCRRGNNLPSKRKEFYWAIQDFQSLFRDKRLNKYFI